MIPPIAPPEDDLVFLDETTPSNDVLPVASTLAAWRIMIIDDDADVHSATTFALSNIEMQHRPLAFLHAYSAKQARELLQKETDIAVILLDVVMEQQDAGLQLVHFIRDECGMTDVRIILRTGQPGYAPEIDAIRDYDINDYKTKSELTRTKLFTSVTAAIRSYEQIRALNASRRGLDLIVQASTELMALHGLQNFAAGVITQIAGLLNLKPEGLLCVQGDSADNQQSLFIIAAAGDYTRLINHPITEIGNVRIVDALSQAIFERRNFYYEDFTALYFAGSTNRNFAAFLNLNAPLNETDQRLLEVFCSNISVGLDNVLLVSKLHNFAFFDPLSKLPNRTRLVEILEEILAAPNQRDSTLALVDIDHFAEINDTLGHQFGDQLLLAVSDRLQSKLGIDLVVARVGGDTFAVLGNNAQVHPDGILQLFNTPFSIESEAVQLSATLGLVALSDYTGGGANLLKDADIALKRAKLHQRAGHLYFSPAMETEIHNRVQTMHALHAAFEEKTLSVAYQPQVDLATRKPTGAEALLRWQTADGSFIPPEVFIPIAEYSGLVIELGAWVLRAACDELVRLRQLGFVDFVMSVNVSQAQFRHPLFLNMLHDALQESGAPASAIELEITESMAMEDPAFLIKTLELIKQTGVNIAIDDFGTGFSSLNYLQQLQIDRIKIDRSFIIEITNSSRGSSIAEMIIQLGRSLDLPVIAEGVENEQQASILTTLGCPFAQGFLFAQPLTPEQLHVWLKDNGAH